MIFCRRLELIILRRPMRSSTTPAPLLVRPGFFCPADVRRAARRVFPHGAARASQRALFAVCRERSPPPGANAPTHLCRGSGSGFPCRTLGAITHRTTFAPLFRGASSLPPQSQFYTVCSPPPRVCVLPRLFLSPRPCQRKERTIRLEPAGLGLKSRQKSSPSAPIGVLLLAVRGHF